MSISCPECGAVAGRGHELGHRIGCKLSTRTNTSSFAHFVDVFKGGEGHDTDGINSEPVAVYDYSYVKKLKDVLGDILDDATGDIENPKKRLWPIRAVNYRKAAELLEIDE